MARNRRKSRRPAPAPLRRTVTQADRQRTRRRITLTLYTILLGVIGTALLTSPALEIKQVQLEGVSPLVQAEQEKTRQLLQLRPGTNWFRAPVGRLQQELTQLPWVQSARVWRKFPNRVEAKVVLRQPVAMVLNATGAYEIDAQTVPIRKANPVASALPPIVWTSTTVPQWGKPLSENVLEQALHIFDSARKEGRVPLRKISIDQSGNLCLNMQDGLAIQLGPPESIEAKLNRVRQIYRLQPDAAQHFTSINLTVPTAPAGVLIAQESGDDIP